MALTDLQRRICRLLAANRVASGESYVAGGTALNEVIGATRISRDVDLFHDTDEALLVTAIAEGRPRFRRGSIRGTLPRLLASHAGG